MKNDEFEGNWSSLHSVWQAASFGSDDALLQAGRAVKENNRLRGLGEGTRQKESVIINQLLIETRNDNSLQRYALADAFILLILNVI